MKYDVVNQNRKVIMGIAILWIMIFHSEIQLQTGLYQIKLIGYGGVDIFLFLSGVGMFHSLQKESNLKKFYKKRCLRILPYYVPIVLIYTICVLRSFDVVQIVLNCTTLSYWIDTPSAFNWYIPALLVFYFISPLYFEFFLKTQRKLLYTCITIAVAFFCLVLIWFNQNRFLVVVSRLPIFFLGYLLGYYASTNKTLSKRAIGISCIALLFGVILLFSFICLYPSYLEFYGLWWYPFILIGPSMVIIISAVLEKLRSKGIKIIKNLLEFLGENSLCIFLFNVCFTRFNLYLTGIGKTELVRSPAYLIFCFAFNIAIACVYQLAINFCIKRIKKMTKKIPHTLIL